MEGEEPSWEGGGVLQTHHHSRHNIPGLSGPSEHRQRQNTASSKEQEVVNGSYSTRSGAIEFWQHASTTCRFLSVEREKKKKKYNSEENLQYSRGSITRCSFVTGVRFVLAAPKLRPCFVITIKSVFKEKWSYLVRGFLHHPAVNPAADFNDFL